jgi:hypothetical protein
LILGFVKVTRGYVKKAGPMITLLSSIKVFCFKFYSSRENSMCLI